MWLSVTMIGTSFGSPFCQNASRMWLIMYGSRYSVAQSILRPNG